MQMKQVWIISRDGLQLFTYTIQYCPKCNNLLSIEDGRYFCASCSELRTALDKEKGNIENFLRASGIHNIISYFSNFLLGEPTNFLLTNDFLWVIDYFNATHYHYQEKKVTNMEQILFAVLTIARIDLSIPIKSQEKVLRDFCKSFALEFYSECGEAIQTFISTNFLMFDKFKPRCIELIREFQRASENQISQELRDMGTR